MIMLSYASAREHLILNSINIIAVRYWTTTLRGSPSAVVETCRVGAEDFLLQHKGNYTGSESKLSRGKSARVHSEYAGRVFIVGKMEACLGFLQ